MEHVGVEPKNGNVVSESKKHSQLKHGIGCVSYSGRPKKGEEKQVRKPSCECGPVYGERGRVGV